MTPKSYKVRFIEPGIMSYTDSGAGVVLVSKEALDKMAPTFRNCPVIFVPEHHNDADKENSFNFENIGANQASGIVTGLPFWGDDGWQWVEMSVWDEQAQHALDEGYSVSCAYEPMQDNTGGIWHELPYDAEVVDGKYMHMAIVPKPRYEGSMVLANSKGGNALNIFKKKNAVPAEPEKAKPFAGKETPAEEKAELVNDDTMIDVNGTPVPLHELVAKYEESKGGGAQPVADEDEIGLSDGSKVTLAELKAAYGAGGGSGGENLENAEEPQDTKGEPVVDEKKQLANSAPAKKTVNAALKNAASKEGGMSLGDNIDSESKRLERGTARYSLPVSGRGGK